MAKKSIIARQEKRVQTVGFKGLGLALAMLGALTAPGWAQEFDTKAPFALLMDYQSGTLLFHKNADERLEPASMAKLMTVAVVFDELQQGRLSMSDEFFISEKAWREGGAASGGSTMFAELNSSVSVGDLLRSVIIQSGNDAAIALAEGIGGSEATFASMMNRLGAEIGLTNSNFVNSTGLPDPNQYSTARDLATIGRFIIAQFPEYYPMFAEPEFTWNGIRQANRNSLVEMGIGVDDHRLREMLVEGRHDRPHTCRSSQPGAMKTSSGSTVTDPSEA